MALTELLNFGLQAGADLLHRFPAYGTIAMGNSDTRGMTMQTVGYLSLIAAATLYATKEELAQTAQAVGHNMQRVKNDLGAAVDKMMKGKTIDRFFVNDAPAYNKVVEELSKPFEKGCEVSYVSDNGNCRKISLTVPGKGGVYSILSLPFASSQELEAIAQSNSLNGVKMPTDGLRIAAVNYRQSENSGNPYGLVELEGTAQRLANSLDEPVSVCRKDQTRINEFVLVATYQPQRRLSPEEAQKHLAAKRMAKYANQPA